MNQVVMLLAILACWATFAGGPPALVNTDADGERVPLGPATAWAADAEATRVAFVTPARALPDLDANDVDDVYVKDLATGELVLASRGADGTAAGGTYPLAISGDGRRVAYVAGDRVAVFDLEERATVFVAAPDGHAAAVPVALDHEGATLLLGAATAVDVQAGYLVDLRTLSFTRIGALEGGGFADVRPVDLSADGRTVVFETPHALRPDDADDLLDLYAYDVTAGSYLLVSADADGRPADSPVWAGGPVSSGDGRLIVFQSDARNLPRAAENDAPPGYAVHDVYLKDLLTGELRLVSTDERGVPADGASLLPSVSRDGRFVAFVSYAGGLAPVPDVRPSCDPYDCPPGLGYVKDLATGRVAVVTVGLGGQPLTGRDLSEPRVSGDGRYVTFAVSSPGTTGGVEHDLLRAANPLREP